MRLYLFWLVLSLLFSLFGLLLVVFLSPIILCVYTNTECFQYWHYQFCLYSSAVHTLPSLYHFNINIGQFHRFHVKSINIYFMFAMFFSMVGCLKISLLPWSHRDETIEQLVYKCIDIYHDNGNEITSQCFLLSLLSLFYDLFVELIAKIEISNDHDI